MKKFLAVVLALAMVLAVSAFAFAEETGLKYEEVKVPSTLREGAQIPAFITLPAEEAEEYGLVVMIHGHGGNHNEWGGYDVISNGIAANGKIVVTLDFPGCGASEESFQLNTMTNMKQDVLDVINYMKETYAIGTVGGFGYSMGGRIILEMIVEDMFAFDSIEFVAPAEDYADLKGLFGGPEAWDEMSAKAHEDGFITFTTIYGQNQELSAEWFDDLAKYEDGLAEAAAEKYDGPCIVVYATDDEAVSPAVSQGVADAFGATVYNTYTAGHSYSFYSDDPEVCATVNDNSIAFFSGEAAAPAAEAPAAAGATEADLPTEPEFDPNPDYDEYTVVEYTIEAIQADLVCTISRKSDNSEFYLECNFYGDDQMTRTTYDGTTYEILEDKTGFMKGDTPAILDIALEQDIWVPIAA